MKPVLLNKRKINFKDILRMLGIFFIHIAVFYGCVFFFIFLYDFITSREFSFDVSSKSWFLLYTLTVGPLFNAVVHIWYAESGITHLRAILWIHSMTLLIVMPIVVIVSM